jgi:hypothetical protein
MPHAEEIRASAAPDFIAINWQIEAPNFSDIFALRPYAARD